METEKHECAPENAERMREWVQKRGGVAVWRSADLSNPGASWSTPALTVEGKPMGKPTWQAHSEPERVITDLADIVVVTRREVKRFRVGLRRGGQGFKIKLTDASSRRVRAAVDKAGKGASYHFDYDQQEAVITVPDESIPLSEWQPEEKKP